MPPPIICKIFEKFLAQKNWAVKIVGVVCRGVHFATTPLATASKCCARKGLETMEMALAFLDFSNGGRGESLRAQRELSNININSHYQSFMGTKRR
jgi:hypothetical protein